MHGGNFMTIKKYLYAYVFYVIILIYDFAVQVAVACLGRLLPSNQVDFVTYV